MRLDADLVLLSACNTAGTDSSPGAPGLSGLARAFLFAGARALLVAHWKVYSIPAEKLTAGAIAAARNDRNMGHSEAMQRSMIAMIDVSDTPELTHPSAWAPFVIVGDGRAWLQFQ